MIFNPDLPLALSPSAVLVTLETAGAVLDLQVWQIIARIESGTLAAFDFSREGRRQSWRVWVPSMRWDTERPGLLAGRHLVAAVTHQLFASRPAILSSEISMRCSLDCSVLFRLLQSGRLAEPDHRTAAYLMARGGPRERRRGQARAILVTRDSWMGLLAARGPSFHAQQCERLPRN